MKVTALALNFIPYKMHVNINWFLYILSFTVAHYLGKTKFKCVLKQRLGQIENILFTREYIRVTERATCQ